MIRTHRARFAPVQPVRLAALLVLALVVVCGATAAGGMIATDLRCERQTAPLAIDTPTPSFRWRLADTRRGARQSAFRIVVHDLLEARFVWDSGKVVSDRTGPITYAGAPLAAKRQYGWAVQVWDRFGVASAFSAPAVFETAVFNAATWKASWIGVNGNAALLRRAFTLTRPVRRARVFATARGLYRLRLNGRPVGDAAFAPDWTDYRARSLYQAYDVTADLVNGKNVIGAWLGKGWFGSRLTWKALSPYRYGPGPPRLFLELHLEFSDNTTQTLVTDTSWRGTPGPITESTLYDGETHDARLDTPGWDSPGFDDKGWFAPSAVAVGVPLDAQQCPPIRVTESIRPVGLTQPVAGVHVFDMGRNIVGWVRLRARGSSGTRIEIRHAEVLTTAGRVDTYNLRSAKALDTFILAGTSAVETFEPRFTYHGFRYVEVTGYPGTPTLDDLTGRVVRTDAAVVGTFACSSSLVNDIWACTRHGLEGNLFGVPTDCPQRDERLGWMGDAGGFWSTACYAMDLAAFSAKWCRDIRDAQRSHGVYQDIAPEVPGLRTEGTPFWADAGIRVPHAAWRHFGDTSLLSAHYSSLQRWLTWVESGNPNYLWQQALGSNYGDWMAPSGNPSADRPLLATAVWAESLRMAAEIARALGHTQDAAGYEALRAKVAAAFAKQWVSAQGVVGSGAQTAQVLALEAGLVPSTLVQAATDHLVADIRKRGDGLSTGFIGTPFLLPVLSDAGRDDVAGALLLQTALPSWGYMVKHGATTMWERWDNDVHCSGRRDDLCSFNHFCFGAVCEWLFRYLAGIDQDPGDAGFESLVIRPRPVPGITWAEAAYDAGQGPIRVRWEAAGGNFSLRATIPPNTRATIHLPAADPSQVREGGRPITPATGIAYVGKANGRVIFSVPAGSYAFTAGGLSADGSPRPGGSVGLSLVQPSRAGRSYQLAAALSRVNGIAVSGVGVIPLDPDMLLFLSISPYLPTVFADFRGLLDARGAAHATLRVPAEPLLIGARIHLAAVTVGTSGIDYISNGVTVTIQP